MTTLVYTCFHLNLAFSSIEEEQRPHVINRCYWPLLRLAERGYRLGIEASGYTLEAIAALDPDWIAKLKALIEQGQIELVASGYTQMIAPLAPADLTRANLRLGLDTYKALLGVRPTIALVNEQAYSDSILPLYAEAGFEALMLDWADGAHQHPNWSKRTLDVTHLMDTQSGSTIAALWSDAILFQKVQRLAHGEVSFAEFTDYLDRRAIGRPVALPLYTSDAEIFDFRPGRFDSEAQILHQRQAHHEEQEGQHGEYESEWERLERLFATIARRDDFAFALPSEAHAARAARKPRKVSSIGTAQAPVSVKKQRKYNLTRWGVSGRLDLALNTACWRAYETARLTADDSDWKSFCLLWASDYRTHITEKRLKKLLAQIPLTLISGPAPQTQENSPERAGAYSDPITIVSNGRFTILEADDCFLILNRYRGLAVHAFGTGPAPHTMATMPDNAWLGTMPHGALDDLAFAADFYSAHLVIEPHDRGKITDLERCEPKIEQKDGCVRLTIHLQTRLGEITKTLTFTPKDRRLDVSYGAIASSSIQLGSIRLAHCLLNPEAFDRDTLFYRSHQGGDHAETFSLREAVTSGAGFDHSAPVSRLVSSTTAIGMTGGQLDMGDARRFVRITMDRRDAAGLGMMKAARVRGEDDDTWFVRGLISIQESDETRRPSDLSLPDPRIRYSIALMETPLS